MIKAMTAIPAKTLKSATPSMKRPRGSVNRTDIKAGVHGVHQPADKKRQDGENRGRCFGLGRQRACLEAQDLRARMTALRFVRVSARPPPVLRCSANATT